jgi:C-terminal processing protease CtpA/Prc
MPAPNTPLAMSRTAAESMLRRLELVGFGARVPFYLTPEVKARFAVSEPITLSARKRKELGLEDTQSGSKLYAVTYSACGRRLLLLRIGSFDVTDTDATIKYIAALLDEQADGVDGLVLDNTHNNGGNIDYPAKLVSLLIQRPAHGLVHQLNGDRRWVGSYLRTKQTALDAHQTALAEWAGKTAQAVDDAYSHDRRLTPPLPLEAPDEETIEPNTHWRKPFIVTIDELSVSSADALPLLVQANQLAPLFGARTMGGGGTVESVAVLTHTRRTLSVTRGLFTVHDPTGAYPDDRYIEDHGVSPDIEHTHTLADFRAGYVGYVEAFSRALVAQIERAAKR